MRLEAAGSDPAPNGGQWEYTTVHLEASDIPRPTRSQMRQVSGLMHLNVAQKLWPSKRLRESVRQDVIKKYVHSDGPAVA